MTTGATAIRHIQLVALANDMAARISRLSDGRRDVVLMTIEGAEILDAQERMKQRKAPVIKFPRRKQGGAS